MSAVLSALVVLTAGCQRWEPAVEPGERHTVNVDWSDPSMLLRAGELGSNWHEGDARPGLPPWPWEQNDCPDYRSGDYTAKSHRRGAVERYYHPSDGSPSAHHVVERYEPGWAERNFDDVHRVLLRCASYGVLGSQVSFDIVDSAYLKGVGMLVRGRIAHADTPAAVTYFVMVKRGELVSTFSLPDPGSQAAVDSVAATAAARLG
ncbi:hypothetical protein JNW91_00880 [Micromonospora sp. STR1_7]|uniref:Sensor domain-containing protein n=1 Tax=Micromonospora parastrephiae TaxID=2806101 RepID=A0ABS1XMS4_9ACTN|nr:hypothetical protein [Micromonospora parastrephiae]MBM0230554.1 hypothetical protein [Micromonospora parastrephiae]